MPIFSPFFKTAPDSQNVCVHRSATLSSSFSRRMKKQQPPAKRSALAGAASSILDAVALQDHIARSVLGGEPPPRRQSEPPLRKGPGPPVRVSIFERTTAVKGVGAPKASSARGAAPGPAVPVLPRPQSDPVIVSALEAVLQSFAATWECACGAANTGDALKCAICAAPRGGASVAPARPALMRGGGTADAAGLPPPPPKAGGAGPHLLERLAGTWLCERAGCAGPANDAGAAACAGCGAPRPRDAPSRAPVLSLAQQRGLVPAPAPLLSDSEWAAVERRALDRALGRPWDRGGGAGGGGGGAGEALVGLRVGTGGRRGGAAGPEECCPICMDAFALRDQVGRGRGPGGGWRLGLTT